MQILRIRTKSAHFLTDEYFNNIDTEINFERHTADIICTIGIDSGSLLATNTRFYYVFEFKSYNVKHILLVRCDEFISYKLC